MSTESSIFPNEKRRKSRNIWKIVRILLIVGIVLFALWAAFIGLISYWSKVGVERRQLPTSGDYYCEELGAMLHIVDSSFYLRLKDGRQQEVFPGYSGRIDSKGISEVFDFYARYMWNQKKDWIELEIDIYPEPFQEGKKYCFKRINIQ